MTDALAQITGYTYALDDRPLTVAFTSAVHATPGVTLTYNTAYPRLATMTDGTGVTTYGYVPINPGDAVYGDGQLASVDGPVANDTITYEYDQLGRSVKRSINGAANQSTVAYDALGRVSVLTNPLGEFDPTYVNQTGRLDHVLWPNGQRTNFTWKPNAQDQRLESITHLDVAGLTQSQHTYSYDVEGRILTWQKTVAGVTTTDSFGYNNSDELEQAVQRANPTDPPLHSHSYAYDASGNRVSVADDGKFTSYTANASNQLTAASGSGPMLFRGAVSKPSTITLATQPVAMDGLNWSAWANVAPGANSLELKATETNVAPGFNAQTTTRHIQLTLTADANRTLVYDANGNMTDNGGTQTYEWDAVNRLTAINYTGTTGRTEFTYDGLGRRVKILEKTGTTVTSDRRFVWEGLALAEERDASGGVVKQFFGQGEMRGALGLFYARDHLGSVREMTDSTGNVRARYGYDPYGNRSANQIQGANALDCDFGFTGYFYHSGSSICLAPFRQYAPDLGRWLSRDPIGENGGFNQYDYVGNGVPNRIDPLGFDWIGYNGVSLTWYKGNYPDTTHPDGPSSPAASGLKHHQSAAEVDSKGPDGEGMGPIPPGSYHINLGLNFDRIAPEVELPTGTYLGPSFGVTQIPKKADGTTFYPNWGNWRARLEPNPGTNARGRKRVYLHDSGKGFSHGCIDHSPSADILSKLRAYKAGHNNSIDVHVAYPSGDAATGPFPPP